MKRGFTLIELMIVVAIIAIIIALVSPIFFGEDSDRNSSTRKRVETCDLACQADKYSCNREQLELVQIETDLCQSSESGYKEHQQCYPKAKMAHCIKGYR